MIRRTEAGTDVAMIGAWDAGTLAEPIRRFRDLQPTLEADANSGRLYLIYTGGDGSWLVEVRLREAAPDPSLFHAVPRALLLSLPTGRMKVGGVEDYRSPRPPQITSNADVFAVPPGDYLVRLHICRDRERPSAEAATDEQLRKRVSPEDLHFSKRWQRLGCGVALFALISFPLVAWQFGLLPALAVAFASLFGTFAILDRWTRNDPRQLRVTEARQAIAIENAAHLPADLLFELIPVAAGAEATGGVIELEKEDPPET